MLIAISVFNFEKKTTNLDPSSFETYHHEITISSIYTRQHSCSLVSICLQFLALGMETVIEVQVITRVV